MSSVTRLRLQENVIVLRFIAKLELKRPHAPSPSPLYICTFRATQDQVRKDHQIKEQIQWRGPPRAWLPPDISVSAAVRRSAAACGRVVSVSSSFSSMRPYKRLLRRERTAASEQCNWSAEKVRQALRFTSPPYFPTHHIAHASLSPDSACPPPGSAAAPPVSGQSPEEPDPRNLASGETSAVTVIPTESVSAATTVSEKVQPEYTQPASAPPPASANAARWVVLAACQRGVPLAPVAEALQAAAACSLSLP